MILEHISRILNTIKINDTPDSPLTPTSDSDADGMSGTSLCHIKPTILTVFFIITQPTAPVQQKHAF